MKSLTICAFDVGTYSIKGIIGRKNLSNGEIEILSQDEAPCSGMRNGEIIKIERVADSLLNLKERLIKKSGHKIKEGITNINGTHIFSILSQGLVSVSRADQKISVEDINRVLRAAQAVHLPSNKEVLDILPLEYIIDSDSSVKNPVGLNGIRLEVKALLLGVFSPVLENLNKAFNLAGISLLGSPIPSPLSSPRAILTEEHKELGSCVIDIGSSTTSIVIFEKGELLDFAILPIGSANITNDIAICLRTEISTAEIIKKQFGSLKSVSNKEIVLSAKKINKKLTKSQQIECPEEEKTEQEKLLSLISDFPSFTPKLLKNIVEDRFNQIFFEIQRSMKKINNNNPLPSGVFFTGGGSLMPGIVDLAKQKLKLPCRLGVPYGVIGCNDIKMAGCLGLLMLGFDELEEEDYTPMKSNFKENLKRFFRIFLP